MARPRITDEQLVATARQVAQQTQDIRQLRQALAVLLPAELNASLEQTARMLGRGRPLPPGLGRTATHTDERRGRTGVPAALGRTSAGRWSVGFVADSGCAGPALGAEGGNLGRLPLPGASWMEEGSSGHASSQDRSSDSGGLEKKLPEDLAALLTTEAVRARPVRIMFQDEARFGRMVRIRRCWSPAPSRPMVDNGYERQFTYVYGAVSPIEGELDWKISPQMNTEQ